MTNKITIEIEDKEALQYIVMLKALGEQLQESGNSNVLLSAGIEALTDKLESNFLKQVNVERIKELR